jgi:Cu2+-exporting ATPase
MHASGAAPAAVQRRDATHTPLHAAGHDKHTGHSVEMFRQKFWGTLLLSVPTVIWSPIIQHWFGYTAPGGTVASRWVPAMFGTLVFVYGG